MLGGIVGVLVPGVLSASAFYMSFHLIRNRPQKDKTLVGHKTDTTPPGASNVLA